METEKNYNEYLADKYRNTDLNNLKMVVEAVCTDVHDIYKVDCITKTVTAIRQSGLAQGLENTVNIIGTYNAAIESYIENNVYPEDKDTLRNFMELSNIITLLKKQERIDSFYRVLREGKTQYFRVKCTRIGNTENFDTVLFAFIPESFDTTQTRIKYSLEQDEVTGVYTKQAFFRNAEKFLNKHTDKAYDIIITDIENFKLINSIHGHKNADTLLCYLAEVYLQASHTGLCGRYGSDHFIILSPAMTDEDLEQFTVLAEEVRLKAPIPYISLHYGINRKVDLSDTVAEMCDKAVLALRSKKGYADKTITIYNEDVIKKHLRTKIFESDFERALNAEEFEIWCQPKYNSFTKRMCGAEALVRWHTADGKFISPGEFIPTFEADGLIVRLDEYVFRYVCSRQRKLLDAGENPLPISVNISRATLYSPDAVNHYYEIIKEIGIPIDLVPLELTESATIESNEISHLVAALKAIGFTLLMDDFGAGYSSLSGLISMPFHTLKLDKSLIDGIGNKQADELLKHIIELAHFFQMEVVAEGVEENSQYNFLKKLSCDTIQGFLFSKPVPFDEYLALKANQPEAESSFMDNKLLADEASVGSLRITNDAKMQVLSALAGIYMTMHTINLKEDTVVEFTTTTNVKEHCNRAHNAPAQMAATMRATVADDYISRALEFTDVTTVAQRLKGKRMIYDEFVGKHFGWFRASFFTVTTNEHDDPETIIFTTQVIEADKHREGNKVQACRTDMLTGVFNKTAWEQDLKSLTDPKVNTTYNREDLNIISVDINGLKTANEAFGRAAGDELIWAVADILNTVLGEGHRIYRFDNDIFAASFYADENRTKEIMETYTDTVRNWLGNHIRHLSTSYGVATKREQPEAAIEDLFRLADERRKIYKANYKAKIENLSYK